MKEELPWPNPFIIDPDYPNDWHGRTIGHDGADVHLPSESGVDDVVAQWMDDQGYDGEVCAVVRLLDGRYMSWETFWGPTGNGFSEDAYGGNADIHFANDLETIIRFGLTDEGREHLGLQLP